MRSHCYNSNEAGGEAYVLYANMTAADGTSMVSGALIQDVLTEFKITYDVYLPFMPRVECPGAFNLDYPEFAHLGLNDYFPGSGMINHIHKRRGNIDIYYFSNTTQTPYNHHVLLRGAFDIEEWNPHSGAITARTSKLFRYRGELYTDLRLTLAPCSSLFFVGTPRAEMDGEIEEISSILNLQSPHAALMSEF